MHIRTKKLHIAIILPTIISKNGTAKQSLELAKVLQSHGHNVSFFTYAYLKKSTYPEYNKFSVYSCVNVEKSLIYLFVKNVSNLENIYLYLSLVFIKKFRKLFIDKDISVYNPHDWMGLWVVTGLKQQKTIIANINDVPQRSEGLINNLKLSRDRKYKEQVDRIIALDNVNKEKVIKWLTIASEKVTVVRSGIDIEKYKIFKNKYNLKKKVGLNKSDVLLVCANVLAPNRRYEDVLAMLARFKKKGIVLHLLVLSKLDFSPAYAERF